MHISPINFNNRTNIYNNRVKKQNDKQKNLQNNNITFASRIDSRPYYPQVYLYETPRLQSSQRETFDTFTGLRDKKSLIFAMENAINLSKCTDKEFSVAMFDMDNFKSINELLGYTTGDEFIKTISEDIDEIAKSEDVKAYRFGGEEFVIIFDKQSIEEIDNVVKSVLTKVGSNPIMKSYAKEYRQKALARLAEDFSNHRKINAIVSLEAKRELVEDLRVNFSSDEAKNDPYFNKILFDINSELNNLYMGLVNERIENESNPDTVDWLIDTKDKMKNGEELEKKHKQELKEYLCSIYDKSYEIHRIKKWLSDFDRNEGFSITGGVVRYSSHALADKTPIDIITEVGEILKRGKSIESGKGYSLV